MKDKKQLEKEIEELNNETDVCEKCILLRAKKLNNFCAIHDIGVAETEATLTQTNEIIKLIEKRIKFCKSQLKGDFEKNIISRKEFEENKIWAWRISGLEELLTEIKGDGE